MAKTSMIAVIGGIMGITRHRIASNGLCTLNQCQLTYSDTFGIPVGGEFVLDIWYQHGRELEVVYIGGKGWVARNPPLVETDDTDGLREMLGP